MFLLHVGPISPRNPAVASHTVEDMTGPDRATRRYECADVEAALSVVPGVAQVSVRSNDGVVTTAAAQDLVRLVLDSDADALLVASSVNRILRMQFGLVLDEGSLEVSTTSAPTGTPVVKPFAPRLAVVENPDVDDFDSERDYGNTVIPLEGDIASFLGHFGRDGSGDFHDEVVTAASRHPSGGRVFIPSNAPSTVAEPDGRARLAIARLTLAADGLGMRALVCLSYGDVEFIGTSHGSSTSAGVNRSVAEATIEAVANAINHRERLDLEAVVITNVNDQRVAVVQVVRFPGGAAERLTGASEVRDDVRQAVIRATLDAVNRRLSEQLGT